MLRAKFVFMTPQHRWYMARCAHILGLVQLTRISCWITDLLAKFQTVAKY